MKTIILMISSFSFGYLVASSKNDEGFKENLEKLFNTYELSKLRVERIIYEIIINVEEINIYELKANIDKVFATVKERLERLWAFETFQEKMDYSRVQIKEVGQLSKDALNKYVWKE